jgi:hypothetical protein
MEEFMNKISDKFQGHQHRRGLRFRTEIIEGIFTNNYENNALRSYAAAKVALSLAFIHTTKKRFPNMQLSARKYQI